MIDIQMTIKMDEGEKIECPCCGTMHKIKLEEVAVTVGQCEDCEVDIIIEPSTMERGTQQ